MEALQLSLRMVHGVPVGALDLDGLHGLVSSGRLPGAVRTP